MSYATVCINIDLCHMTVKVHNVGVQKTHIYAYIKKYKNLFFNGAA